MSRTQSLLLGFLLLLLAGGGVAIWLSDTGGGSDLELTSAQPQAAPEFELTPSHPTQDPRGLEAPPEDQLRHDQTTVAHPLEVELVQIQGGTFESSELSPLGADANARLTGVIRGNRGVGLIATITFIAGPNQGRKLRTDSKGRFGASDLYQGLSMVRVQTESGLRSEREVALRQLSEAELNLDLAHLAGATVYGRVKDPFGEPIQGAEVRLDGGIAITDDQGEFSFPRVTPGKVPVVVKKHGYAHVYQVLGVARSRPIDRDKLTFTMHPGVTLEVRLAAAVGSPGAAKLYILPVGGQAVTTRLGEHTFPWHEINPVEVHPGGTAVVEGLQPGHVSLLAFHPGAIASPPIVNKNLVPGQENQHLVRLKGAPFTIRGKVTDPDGQPARRARVRLEDPTRGFATTKAMQQRNPGYLLGMILPHLPAAVQETRTDNAGRFVLTAFPEITPKGYYLTVESEDGTARANRVVAPERLDLELKLEPIENETGSLSIHMGGRYQGLPIDLKINGQPQEQFVLSAEDDLIVPGLDPGLWRIEVWWNQDRVEQGRQFAVLPRKTFDLPLSLPKGAVEGR